MHSHAIININVVEATIQFNIISKAIRFINATKNNEVALANKSPAIEVLMSITQPIT